MRQLLLTWSILFSLCAFACPAQTCTGLCRQQVACPAGTTTSISGVVYAPNGIDPLPNVLVYVPSAPVDPLPIGLFCPTPGRQPSGIPLVGATTGVDGSFSLSNVPVGTAIPLVIKLGKWRRQLIIPATTACADTSFSTRLPRNQTEGDIPRIAIVSSASDQMECVLRATGIDDSEFTNPAGPGRINIFAGNTLPGAQVGSTTAATESSLMENPVALKAYDVLLLPSQGRNVAPVIDGNQQASLANFVNLGGRAYLSHFEWTYLDYNLPIGIGSPPPAPGPWWVDTAPPGTPAPYVDTPSATIGPFLPEAGVMADWLQATHVTSTRGVIPINRQIQHDLTYSTAQNWFRNSNDPTFGNILQLVAQTPIDAPTAATACGRLVFNDYEIRPTPNTVAAPPTFPAECTAGFLSPEEKAFEYALFELTPDASANLSPITFDFGSFPIGVASPPHPFIWTNNSSFPATATPSSTSPDFQILSTTCGLVPANGTCQVDILFKPTALRLLTGNVVVTSTGLLGTAQAFVQGTGTQDLTFNTPYLQFGTHPVGSVTTLPLTATNIAPFAAPLQPFVITGDFSASLGTCGTSVPANASCTLQVSFRPTQGGDRVGTLTVPSAEPVNLEGMAGDYTLTLAPISGNVEAGKLDTFTAILASAGSPFPGTITLACTTDAPATTCTLPPTVSLDQGSATMTVAVQTTSKYTVPGYGYGHLHLDPSRRAPLVAFAACLPLLLAFRRKKLCQSLLALLLCPILAFALTGCSGKYPALNPTYTPPGTYTVTLTATSAGLQHTATYTLTVRI